MCGRQVDLGDGTSVRLHLARGYDPRREDEGPDDASDDDWAERRTAVFCSSEHATEWMHGVELADVDWAARVEEDDGTSDLGCFVGCVLVVLLALALMVVGVVTVVRALG